MQRVSFPSLRSIHRSPICVASGVLCASIFLLFHFTPLPTSLDGRPLTKVLLSQEGHLLAARIAEDQQWRFPRTRHLPAKYIQALTAFEDRHFYSHPGINPFAIGRAFVGNLKAGRVISGGSTITMQLARMLRQDPPRTYTNKLIEMLIALKLEWHFSKNEILSLYASEAPFGGNTVGIGAASWRYFGRYLQDKSMHSVSQISWAEAAFLAVLPNSPALVHPGRSRDVLLAKRNRLLQTLWQQGKLSENEFRLSLLEPLPQKPKPIPQLASHLLQSLIAKHPQQTIFHSTLKSQLQEKALALSQFRGQQLAREGVHNLAIVVIDHREMETPIYLGNVTSAENTSAYAPAVDIATRPRSTGSVLKPLLYGLMLQSGQILPNTLVEDIPTNYRGFTPENYDHQYRGVVAANQALSRSLNIPAVRMLHQYGISRFYDDLQRMGMSTLFRPSEEYGLSLILGGAEGNLQELTQIYAQLMNSARQGTRGWKHATPKILRDDTPAANQPFVLQQGAAWLTLDALLHVKRPGTESLWQEFSSSQSIAWKTGTSYGLRDAWAIGSNGRYTVGVWAGNAGGEGVPGLSGLNTAAPSLFEIFDLLGHSQWIETPELALKKVETCKDDGYLSAGLCDAEISLAPAGSHFQQITPYHKTIQLDATGQFRVHGGCESVANMHITSRLVLPPVQEFYWRQHHNEYQALPPWREDCITDLASYSDDLPMDIVYPQEGSRVYIPFELDGSRGRVVFQASHRQRKSKLYWHIDEDFVQQTQVFHQVTLDLQAGWHKLILVDELGYRLERWFNVIDKNS
ncbi:Penicillin-binding protein 1C [Thalassocella blandensis]|nr:Penicillin-binding protein 1C [Thalassocella blandensis]